MSIGRPLQRIQTSSTPRTNRQTTSTIGTRSVLGAWRSTFCQPSCSVATKLLILRLQTIQITSPTKRDVSRWTGQNLHRPQSRKLAIRQSSTGLRPDLRRLQRRKKFRDARSIVAPRLCLSNRNLLQAIEPSTKKIGYLTRIQSCQTRTLKKFEAHFHFMHRHFNF